VTLRLGPLDRLSLAPLSVRSFRFQWPADLLTSWAAEMETLILGWYVMTHTGSVLLLTAFGSLQFLGTLAGPVFGVLGDRLGARAILCAMRGAYALCATGVTALALADRLSTAAVLALASIMGMLRPNDLVLRNSLIGDTIPRRHLMAALGMSRATQDSARIAGALVGAGLSSLLGIGRAYVVVAICYAGGLALTLGVASGRPVPDPGDPRSSSSGAQPVGAVRASGWRELLDGLLYVWTTPSVLAAMWLAFLVNLTAYPVTNGLLPYVAKHVYRVGANGLGSLVAGFSLGSLIGSIAMIVTGGARRPERSTIVNVAIWYALLLAFAVVRTADVGVVVLIAAGVAQSVAMISMSATLLHVAGDRFRARVMGVRTLAVYGLPVGLMVSGALIDRIGFAATSALYTVTGLACTLVIGVRWRAHVWRA